MDALDSLVVGVDCFDPIRGLEDAVCQHSSTFRLEGNQDSVRVRSSLLHHQEEDVPSVLPHLQGIVARRGKVREFRDVREDEWRRRHSLRTKPSGFCAQRGAQVLGVLDAQPDGRWLRIAGRHDQKEYLTVNMVDDGSGVGGLHRFGDSGLLAGYGGLDLGIADISSSKDLVSMKPVKLRRRRRCGSLPPGGDRDAGAVSAASNKRPM